MARKTPSKPKDGNGGKPLRDVLIAAAAVVLAALIVGLFGYLNRHAPAPEPAAEKRAEPVSDKKADTEPDHAGLLSPGTQPNPSFPLITTAPDEAIRIYLGGGCAAWTTKDFLVVLRIAAEDIITVKRWRGTVAISAKIRSLDHRIIAEIVDNEFFLNPNNYFRKERPSKSELVVYDQTGAEALRMHYLNPKAIKLKAKFGTPRGLVQFGEKGVKYDTDEDHIELNDSVFGQGNVVLSFRR
jgi:hypothetical protein